MIRSSWKGPFVDNSIIKRFNKVSVILRKKLPKSTIKVLKEKLSDGDFKKSLEKMSKQILLQNPIFIWSRRSFILPNFVGSFVYVYNGYTFSFFEIKSEMINHRFGEFVFTKRMSKKIHLFNRKKGKEKKRK